jgi:hypothetical protein
MPDYHADDPTSRTIRAALEQGEIPSIPLSEALRYLLNRDRSSIGIVSRPAFKFEHLEGKGSVATELWVDDRRVFAVGPRVEELRTALAPYHAVHAPPELELWRHATSTENPWCLLGDAADPQHPLHPFIEPLQRWTRERIPVAAQEMLAPPKGSGTLVAANAHVELRERLKLLACRPVDGTAEAVPLILERLARAPWVLFNASVDSMDLTADMGAGNIVGFRLRTFPNATTPLREVHASLYSSGDCTVALVLRCDRRLEGPTLPARERREMEAQQSDDNYDD